MLRRSATAMGREKAQGGRYEARTPLSGMGDRFAMAQKRDFYDDLETRDPERREKEQFAQIAAQIDHARRNAPYFGKALDGIDGRDVADRAALAKLPIIRKSDLLSLQPEAPPFGGLTAVGNGDLRRVYASPGPIYDAEGYGNDVWHSARALFAAGFRKGDVIHNCFSYHFTPAAFLVEGGAHAIGCAVFPAGIGQTEMQVAAIADIRPQGYVGTPSFLKIILDKAVEMGVKLDSLTRAACGAEAFPPSLRAEIEGHGLDAYDFYGTADLGLIAYQSPAKEGMLIDEEVLVELIDPATGQPAAAGETGEVVVTLLTNKAYPLIRFGTGDLSAILPGTSPCGRTGMRIKGWMGRADQTTKVRGMFVHALQVERILERHAAVKKMRVVVTSRNNKDIMTVKCEIDGGDDALAAAIRETVQTVTKLRGDIEIVPPGQLPRDGKLIEDARSYD